MTTQTVPDQQVADEALSRDEVYTSLLHGLIANLPTPSAISFRSTGVNFTFDSHTDLMAWRAWFGMQDQDVDGQPYPSLSDPADMDRWSSRVWIKWRGWHLGLNSMEAITDEQRDGWVSSGQAASFAEHEAKQAAEATGPTYSREAEPADDPTPVSPARDGAPHVVAVTNGGLVDETPAEPVTVYFSFGHGQTDPGTGKNLLDHYVTIIGPSYEACREAMFASKYGNCWAFEYPDDSPATAEWIPQWTEHDRMVLAADEPPAEVLHMQFASGDTSCGLTQGEYRDGCGTANQAAVTCKTCIDEMPF